MLYTGNSRWRLTEWKYVGYLYNLECIREIWNVCIPRFSKSFETDNLFLILFNVSESYEIQDGSSKTGIRITQYVKSNLKQLWLWHLWKKTLVIDLVILFVFFRAFEPIDKFFFYLIYLITESHMTYTVNMHVSNNVAYRVHVIRNTPHMRYDRRKRSTTLLQKSELANTHHLRLSSRRFSKQL